MKSMFRISVLTFLVVAAPSLCFALMSIANVSKEQAKEMGMEVRSNAAGPNAVRVALEFETKGALKSFSRVDLEIRDGEKWVSAALRVDRSKPGRVIVSFAADRATLDKSTLSVVVQPGPRDMTGYDLRVKDFVDLEKVR